jgi:hypothetical protein
VKQTAGALRGFHGRAPKLAEFANWPTVAAMEDVLRQLTIEAVAAKHDCD